MVIGSSWNISQAYLLLACLRCDRYIDPVQTVIPFTHPAEELGYGNRDEDAKLFRRPPDNVIVTSQHRLRSAVPTHTELLRDCQFMRVLLLCLGFCNARMLQSDAWHLDVRYSRTMLWKAPWTWMGAAGDIPERLSAPSVLE